MPTYAALPISQSFNLYSRMDIAAAANTGANQTKTAGTLRVGQGAVEGDVVWIPATNSTNLYSGAGAGHYATQHGGANTITSVAGTLADAVVLDPGVVVNCSQGDTGHTATDFAFAPIVTLLYRAVSLTISATLTITKVFIDSQPVTADSGLVQLTLETAGGAEVWSYIYDHSTMEGVQVVAVNLVLTAAAGPYVLKYRCVGSANAVAETANDQAQSTVVQFAA